MLQKTLLNLWSNIDEQTDIADYSKKYYMILKKCIRKHQSLIQFNAKLEQIFTLPILSHMVIFSVLMCFDTYEIVLVRINDGSVLALKEYRGWECAVSFKLKIWQSWSSAIKRFPIIPY